MAMPDCTTHQSMELAVPPGNNPLMIYNEGNTVRLWFSKGEASVVYPGLTEARDTGTWLSLPGLRDTLGKP